MAKHARPESDSSHDEDAVPVFTSDTDADTTPVDGERVVESYDTGDTGSMTTPVEVPEASTLSVQDGLGTTSQDGADIPEADAGVTPPVVDKRVLPKTTVSSTEELSKPKFSGAVLALILVVLVAIIGLVTWGVIYYGDDAFGGSSEPASEVVTTAPTMPAV